MSEDSQLTQFRSRLSQVKAGDVTQTLHYPSTSDPQPIEGLEAIGTPIQLSSILGQGGMGTVYLGHQGLPEREVAVKKARDSGGKLERLLLHEATITGRLEHPNIVPIHEIRQSTDQEIEVVMKRIQGTTLRELLSKSYGEDGTLDTCLNVLVQTSHALAFAHSQGVIHRDVKTQNIMIGDFGETYLLDWGIAIQQTHLSRFQEGLVGTPSGMAPEMLSGKLADISEATDIYLLGSTLHEVLMGTPRYQKEGTDLFQEIRRSEPFEYPDHIPKELGELANRSCHQDPEERIKSVIIFREAVEQYRKNKHANALLATGLKEMKVVEAIIKLENRTKLERTKLYYHLHRSRFAYERALAINPGLGDALTNLQKLVNNLAKMLLEEGNHEAAAWFGESSGLLDPAIQQEIEAAVEKSALEKKENERLQDIGKENDPMASIKTRAGLGVGLLFCAMVLLSSLYFHGNNETQVTAGDLLMEALVLCGGVALFLFLLRRKLMGTLVGQRAMVGVIGALGGMLAIRWACASFGIEAGATITLEKFVVAAAFITAYPAIPSGMKIGFLSLAAGAVGVIWPLLQVLSSVIMLTGVVAMLSWDALSAMKHDQN